MATNVGSIEYDVRLNTKDFKKDINSVDTEAKSIGSKLSNIGSSAERLSAGIIAVGTALAFAANAALKNASEYQQSRIAFDTMLGSAQKGQAIMQQLSDFAKKTPFDLPQVVQGAKSLLAYGIEAEKIIPTFNALGNIAAGVGRDKLPQLTLAFGQVRTAGKLTGQELRQFTEAGVPLLDALAQQSGKSAAQIKQDMENGMAPSFAEVEQAIMGMSQNGGKFFNLMEKQSQTFAGRMSNIGDSVGQIIRGMLGVDVEGNVEPGSIFDRVSKAAENLMNFLESNKEIITNTFKTMFGWILDNGDVIAVFIGTILVAAIVAFTASLIAANFQMLLIAAAVAGLYLVYKMFKPQIDSVIEAFKKFWDSIKPIRDFIANLFTQAIDSLKQAWDNLMPKLQEFWAKHGPMIMNVLKVVGIVLLAIVGIIVGVVIAAIWLLIKAFEFIVNVISWWIDGFNNATKVTENVVNSIVQAWNSLVAFLTPIFQAIWNTISTVFNNVYNFIKGILEFILNIYIIVWGTIFITVYNALMAVWNFIVGVWNAIWGWLQPILQGILDFYISIWTNIYNTISNVLNAVWGFIQSIWATIWGYIGPTVMAIWNFISSAFENGKNTLSNIMNNIFNFVSNIWNRISNTISDAVNGIKNFFAGAGEWLYNAGKSIFEGLIKGIQDIAGKVKGAAQDVMNQVRNLLPFSPAKEGPFSGKGWTLYSGQSLMQGLAAGISKAADLPAMAMQSALGEAQASFANTGLSSINSMSNGSQTGSNGVKNNNIGVINISNEIDGQYWLKKLNDDQETIFKGLTPRSQI